MSKKKHQIDDVILVLTGIIKIRPMKSVANACAGQMFRTSGTK